MCVVSLIWVWHYDSELFQMMHLKTKDLVVLKFRKNNVFSQNDKILPEKFNVQVGTKRYMAPELISNKLNPKDFSQFKMADIYSMALVMWEVAIRVEV